LSQKRDPSYRPVDEVNCPSIRTFNETVYENDPQRGTAPAPPDEPQCNCELVGLVAAH
jgi:hypothetical protein